MKPLQPGEKRRLATGNRPASMAANSEMLNQGKDQKRMDAIIELVSPARPGRYDVRLYEEVIVRGSRDPEHDAARVLLARGITGPMVTTRANGSVCLTEQRG